MAKSPLINIVTLLIPPLITTHEPPSRPQTLKPQAGKDRNPAEAEAKPSETPQTPELSGFRV